MLLPSAVESCEERGETGALSDQEKKCPAGLQPVAGEGGAEPGPLLDLAAASERDSAPQARAEKQTGLNGKGGSGSKILQGVKEKGGGNAGGDGPPRDQVRERVGERIGTRCRAEAGGLVPTVVVVGGGLAGLSAAIEVLRGGGNVVIVEKCAKLGGNSAKASSGINAAGSRPQKEHGIRDNPEDFRADTLRSGKGRSSEELVSVLVNGSSAAIDFLESFGVDLSSITQLGGHSHPRTHRNKADGAAMNLGYRIMSTLIKHLEQQPAERVRIITGMRAFSLVRDEALGARVVGVRLRPAEAPAHATAAGSGKEREAGQRGKEGGDEVAVRGGSVVLATGGFSADREGLLAQYVPKVRQLPTTNGLFAVGEGVKIAVESGASVVDMDQVQLHPTGFVDPQNSDSPTKFLAPEALRGCGGLLLNHAGQRFVDELTTRDAVVSAMMTSCRPAGYAEKKTAEDANPESASPVVAYMVLDEAALLKFDPAIAAFYIKRGLVQKFQDADELSKAYGIPPDNVAETLVAYSAEGDRGTSGETGAPTRFQPGELLYGAIVTPVLHYCMGGLRIDSNGEVLSSNGVPIGGLLAAGEVTGGVHGRNRLAGNSLLECVVFGRIAGRSALLEASFAIGVASL